jgi:hypothetical protein
MRSGCARSDSGGASSSAIDREVIPMAQSIKTSVLLCFLGLVLAACSTDFNKEPDPNILPANYKQEILDTLMSSLPDPTNVREAFISEPALVTIGKEPRYTVCVRYNGRNQNREYMGSKDRIGFFYGGHLNQLVDADQGQCAKAPYKPFPELEKLCLAKKCE